MKIREKGENILGPRKKKFCILKQLHGLVNQPHHSKPNGALNMHASFSLSESPQKTNGARGMDYTDNKKSTRTIRMNQSKANRPNYKFNRMGTFIRLAQPSPMKTNSKYSQA